MNIPERSIGLLICGKCFSLLVGPTYTFPERQCSLCQMCAERTTGDKFRELPYEAMAANFLFPCTNNVHGCWKQLKPLAIQEHEPFCPFMIKRCTLGCGWSGLDSRLIEHFTDAHPTKILHHNTPKEVNCYSSSFAKFLLVTEQQIFDVSYTCENNFFDIAISFPSKSPRFQAYRVNISINVNTKKTFVITNKSEPKFSRIKIEDDLFHFKISVLSANTVIRKPPPENKFILDSLICCMCKSLMHQKIYCCEGSRNCCQDCKSKQGSSLKFTATRNLALESLIPECLYPCKNPGCVQILKPGELTAHYSTCEFREYQCPICSCGIKRSTSHAHFNNRHRLHVKRDGCMEFYYTEASEITSFYFHREAGFFKLSHRYFQRVFSFSVEYWGNPAYAGRYTFCIKMQSDDGEEFVAEQKCAAFKSSENTFDDPLDFINVPSSILQPFITNKMLPYQVYIYKAQM